MSRRAARAVRACQTVGIFAFVLLLCAPLAAWQPLPEPMVEDVIGWKPLLDPQAQELSPGESLRFEPGRLAVVRIQYQPADAYSELSIDRIHATDGAEARVRLRPTLLAPGDLLVVTTMDSPAPIRVALHGQATRPVTIAAARMTALEPWLYWEWWQDRLHAWVDAGAVDEVPQGLAVPGRNAVREEGRRAQLVWRIIDRLGASEAEKLAAQHLVHALMLRAVQRNRKPYARFYARRDVAGALLDRPSRVRVDTGTFAHEAWAISPGVPATLEVEGPAVVRLGLRAIKEPSAPNLISRFELAVHSRARRVHHAKFSSRAALRREPKKTETTDEQNDDEEDEEDEERLEASTDYVEDSRGRVVGWRRTTQWWVPPGRHRYELAVEGASVLVDGRIHRPKTHVQDALRRREDVAWHIARARELASGDTIASRVVQAELAALEERFDEAQIFLAALARAEGEGEGEAKRLLAAWQIWRRIAWFTISRDRLEEVFAHLDDETLPRALRRQMGQALLEQALEAEHFVLARRLADLMRQRALYDASDAVSAPLAARAQLLGGEDREARWQGLSNLWSHFRAEPLDPVLRRHLQQGWWYASYWDGLRADREPDVSLLQPLGGADERLATSVLRERHGLLFSVTPGSTYELLGASPAGFPSPFPSRPTSRRACIA